MDRRLITTETQTFRMSLPSVTSLDLLMLTQVSQYTQTSISNVPGLASNTYNFSLARLSSIDSLGQVIMEAMEFAETLLPALMGKLMVFLPLRHIYRM